MKKICVLPLLILLLLSPKVFASHTEATFSAFDRNYIQVIMDGHLVNDMPSQQVFVPGSPGRHGVEIKVFNQWGRLQFIHTDRILVKPSSRNNFILQVYPYGKVRLVQHSKTIPAPAVAPKVPKPIRTFRPMVACLSTQDLRGLQQHLLYLQSDRQRMAVAKKSLHGRELYAEDVRELLYLFDFESSRLRFAEFAFPRVIDPQYYSSVYDAFQYRSTVYQLEDYLARAY